MKPLRILYITATLLLLFVTLLAADYYFKLKSKPGPKALHAKRDESADLKLKSIALKLNDFNADHTYNNEIAFIADMRIESGSNRFFVYDLKNDSVIAASLVTHGRCNKTWLNGRQYSNVIGSGCTSPGKYRIGKAYYGRFGLAYKLHGLDETNSNAYQRYVVLHAHDCVPEKEIAPSPICQSDGCPTVAPGFLKKLQAMIDKSEKPVLLTICR
jgi:hypothetical protein